MTWPFNPPHSVTRSAFGHDVDGFSRGVVEIKLQAVRKSLVKARLQSVVIGVAFDRHA